MARASSPGGRFEIGGPPDCCIYAGLPLHIVALHSENYLALVSEIQKPLEKVKAHISLLWGFNDAISPFPSVYSTLEGGENMGQCSRGRYPEAPTKPQRNNDASLQACPGPQLVGRTETLGWFDGSALLYIYSSSWAWLVVMRGCRTAEETGRPIFNIIVEPKVGFPFSCHVQRCICSRALGSWPDTRDRAA